MVEITRDADEPPILWHWCRPDAQQSCYNAVDECGFPTVREALHAARVAAGLGNVAEQPCADFVLILDGHPNARNECADCMWPRASHGESA